MAGEPLIKLDAGLLGNLSAKTSGINSRIDTPVNGIANILGALDWKVKSQSGVENDLKNVRNELQKQGAQLSSLNRVIADATGRINTVTSTLNAKTDAISMQAAVTASRATTASNSVNSTASTAALAAALLAATTQIGAYYTTIKNDIKDKISSIFHHSSGGSSGGGHSGGGIHFGGTGWCDEYKNSVVDMGDGRLMITDPDGNVTIMTQDEYKAYCERKKGETTTTQTQETQPVQEDGPTKSYTLNGANYRVVSNYDEHYNLYQQNYALPVVNGGSSNEGCMACCVCMSYNIRNKTEYQMTGQDNKNKDGIVVDDSENIKYVGDHSASNPVYGKNGYVNDKLGIKGHSEAHTSLDDNGNPKGPLVDADGSKRRNIIEQSISNGNPVMVGVNKKGVEKYTSTHFVLCVGLTEPHSTPPTEANLLVVDPARADNPVVLSDTKYYMGINGNVWT